jgi:two-component sensor histidine kinase
MGFMHALRLAVESGQPQSYEYELTLPNHSSGNYEARFVVSDDAQVLVLIRDITEQKQIQPRVKSSLAEKETLLKEIHHRVKNNLQIVNSLLYLQSKNIQEPELRAIFQESQNRVRTMSLIHEQLYQADDLARIDFAVYLKNLSRNLFQTYRSGNAIELRLKVQNVSLTIDQAIPCGLIINELISNSLKYAFPYDRAGVIEVQFYHDAAYTLVVRDDGVGFPADPDLAGVSAREILKIYSRRSLGLQLVENLVRQLDGQIEMFLDHGVMYKISFA